MHPRLRFPACCPVRGECLTSPVTYGDERGTGGPWSVCMEDITCCTSKQRAGATSKPLPGGGRPRGTQHENSAYPAATPVSTQRVPCEEASAWESPGCWAKVRISATISVSPDACIFPTHRKALNSLTWDFWFSFDVLTLLLQKLL